MDSRRGIFVAGIVLGCALGFVSGHVLVWSRTTHSEPFLVLDSTGTQRTPIRVAEVPPQLFPTDLSTEYTIAEIGSKSDSAARSDSVVLRHGELNTLPTGSALPPGTVAPDEPKPIPVREATPLADASPPAPKDAKPTKADEAFARELRKLIDSELSEYPKSQRDVWFESLKEYSPDHIQGVLQMWKRFGAPTMDLGFEPVLPLPDVKSADRVPSANAGPETLVLPPGPFSDGPAPSHGLSLARALHLRNLAHVQTIGYKRLIPMPVEQSDAGTPTFADCDARLDLSTGLRQPTELPLDWMISGSGFFAVQGEDSILYTRNGHFTLDDERRICLQEGARLHPLVPELQLPEGTQSIHLKAGGTLSVTTTAGDEVNVGQVELAMFANPAGLEPAGNAFFWETAASGTAQKPTAQHAKSEILQGALELSNVKPELEWQAIDLLEDLLER